MQITVTKKYLRAIDRAQLDVQRAACGDSNDDEIDALHNALDLALSALGGPDGPQSWRVLSDRERDRLGAL